MAMIQGSTIGIMQVAQRLARIHVAFQVNAQSDGWATLHCLNQATLDAAVEHQRNQEEDDANRS